MAMTEEEKDYYCNDKIFIVTVDDIKNDREIISFFRTIEEAQSHIKMVLTQCDSKYNYIELESFNYSESFVFKKR